MVNLFLARLGNRLYLRAHKVTRPAMGCLRLINADYAQRSAEAPALTEREFDAGHVISAMLEDTGP